MNLPNSINEDFVGKFNVNFFKNIEKSEDDAQNYLNELTVKFNITDPGELRALIIYYFWTFYFARIFPNVIEKRISQDKDPRKSSVFKYCYKLQKETKGILEQNEYKDYVYCQLRFLKAYKDKTNNAIFVSPSILNLDKGWKKWKYFKYLLSRKNQSVSKNKQYVNNENLKVSLLSDKKFLLNKLEKLNKENIVKNLKDILLWHKIGNISVYFLALCNLIDRKYISKDLTVYNFDDTASKLYKTIFFELL